MKFTHSIAGLLAGVLLAGCGADESSTPNTLNLASAVYPTVDDSFLSATEWRFIGPYRGGRVLAVAGTLDDPFVYYFGAAHGGVWKTTDAGNEVWHGHPGRFDLLQQIHRIRLPFLPFRY